MNCMPDDKIYGPEEAQLLTGPIPSWPNTVKAGVAGNVAANVRYLFNSAFDETPTSGMTLTDAADQNCLIDDT